MNIDKVTRQADDYASQTSNARDMVLIDLGGRCFGLSLSNVRHICVLPADFAYSGAEVETHFVYQGNPHAYISLWDVLKQKSRYLEYEELQTMLIQRRQDHIDWMDALEDAIRHGVAFTKARNPRECAFGKWYYGYHTDNGRLALLMRHFEQPHREIHCLADKLLDLVNADRDREAIRIFQDSTSSTLVKLLELFDNTLTLLSELQRRIAIIVSEENQVFALGADGVRDIVTIPRDRIKPASGMLVHTSSSLIILDDQSVVPVFDWRQFCGSP
ncbi:MAG: CZB domain-containing protein [Gammaproteobacteria bacterium]